MDDMSPIEAMRYLGLYQNPSDYDEDDEEALEVAKQALEAIVIEREDVEIDVDVDGELRFIGGDSLQQVLFDRHEEEVGYRPDDPAVMQDIQGRLHSNVRSVQRARFDRRKRLASRVANEENHPARSVAIAQLKRKEG